MTERESIQTGMTLDEVMKLYPLRRKNANDPGARIVTWFCIVGETLDRAVCVVL